MVQIKVKIWSSDVEIIICWPINEIMNGENIKNEETKVEAKQYKILCSTLIRLKENLFM